MLLGEYIKYIIIKCKAVYKLHFSYPTKYKTSKLQSILPKSIEKLVQEGVNIAENVHISSHLNYLGKEVYIGWDTRITQCLSIGNFTSISNGVKIGLTNHALDHIGTSPLFYAKRRGWVDQDTFSEEGGELVTIGADVLISANVVVLKGIKIGTGAVVGAGSVVTKDIPPYAIVAGVPAKVIKYRFNEVTIDRLIKSEWWNLPNNLIKQHKAFFKNVDEFLTRIGK